MTQTPGHRWTKFHPQTAESLEEVDYFEILPHELQPSPLKENLGNLDRLTQLQDAVEQLTTVMMTSVGVLQRDAGRIPLGSEPITPPLTEQEAEKVKEANSQITSWSQDVVSQMLLVDLLIKHLPGISETEEEQMKKLHELQNVNEEAGKKVLERVGKLEEELKKVRAALRFIVEDQQASLTNQDDMNE